MGTDEAPRGRFWRAPEHRVECADLFRETEESKRMHLRGPHLDEVVEVLEAAAANAGRTWNKQLSYVICVCMGHQFPDADDTRTASQWRALLSTVEYSWDDVTWQPLAEIYPLHHEVQQDRRQVRA